VRRRLLKVALALVPGIVVAGLWIRSYVAEDSLAYRPGQSTFTLHLFQSRGSIASTYTFNVPYWAGLRGMKLESTAPKVDLYAYWGTRSPLVHFGGFAMMPSGVNGGGGVLLPHWFLLVLTMPLPALAAYRAWRLRRRARESGVRPCPACGYDLRATPDRCPECGCVVAGATP